MTSITYNKVKEVFPKREYRSARSRKTFHLKEYSQVLVCITFSTALSVDLYLTFAEEISKITEYKISSHYENSVQCYFQFSTESFSYSKMEELTQEVLKHMNNLQFVGNCSVLYGDAYYGEW